MTTNGRHTMVLAGLTFLTGALAGAAAGLLLAPHSGAYTRRQIRNFAEDVEERARCMADDARHVVEDVVDQGKALVG